MGFMDDIMSSWNRIVTSFDNPFVLDERVVMYTKVHYIDPNEGTNCHKHCAFDSLTKLVD